MKYPIVFKKQSLEEDVRRLFFQLGEHNKKLYPPYENQSHYGFFIKDGKKILGGITGHIWLGTIRIDRIFVQEKLRGQGYGKQLLYQAETYGKIKGAYTVALENLSFQKTLSFYIKHGYFITYQEQNYSNDVILYHLRKKLS